MTTAADWRGFAEVSRVAAQLNRLVADAFGAAGVPVWSLAPSASALCRDGELLTLADRSVSTALRQGLTPLVYGDVALDECAAGRSFRPKRYSIGWRGVCGRTSSCWPAWSAGCTIGIRWPTPARSPCR
ncbi:hypothetical protein [Candidatus Amarolinea dominans]|uniref:hypothetical protein n=1 Tax=Candidatus Amarolinea dominans TaxID=3140696 RepID=UPI0031CCB0DF